MECRTLYYEDCHLSRFTARVTVCQQAQKGWEIQLDATAFYPEGGGQAADTGTLGGVPVTHVREKDGKIFHLCAAPLEVGAQVEGILDYAGRFDRMQQHSGEHIVSGLIHSRWGWHNTGFHMGSDVITIDFDGVIPAQELPSLEAAANEAVWRNIPLKIWTPSEQELPNVRYRTKRALPWPVRIVEVPGFDTCACCGVHVASTGEIGLIKLFSAIPFRGGTRMEMACGRRALEILNQTYDQNRQVSQAFSAKITETGEAARKMNDQLAALKYRITGLERQIFSAIARGYAGTGNVLHFQEGLDNTALRELADAIAETCGGAAAVLTGEEGAYGFCLVTRQGDLRDFTKDMTAALGGRGGGKPNYQQGRLTATRQQIEAFFRTPGGHHGLEF